MGTTTDGPRIRLLGSSGSGKTTIGRAIAVALGVPFLELDGIFRLPVGAPRPAPDECRRMLAAFLSENLAWVVDGNYLEWTQEAFANATEIVVFDIPARVSCGRIIRRWWVWRHSPPIGDDVRLLSLLKLLIYTSRYRRTRLPGIVKAARDSDAPWSLCRSDTDLTALLDRFPTAAERLADEVRRLA